MMICINYIKDLMSEQESKVPAKKRLYTLKNPQKMLSQQQQVRLDNFFQNQNWNNDAFKDNFELVQEYLVEEQFAAYCSEQPKILKHIQNVKFPYMKSLNIWGNQIASIQGICRISMPSLQRLWIWKNKIYSFKSLRKLHLPKLKILDGKQNIAIDNQRWTELNCPVLNRIDTNNGPRSNYQFDILFLVKMEAKNPKSIYYSVQLLRANTNQIIKKRFPLI